MSQNQNNLEIQGHRKNLVKRESANQNKSIINNNNNQNDIEKQIINNKSPKFTRLSRTGRCWLFVIFVFLNIIVNMDNGTVPALIDEIRSELDISKDIVGLFGSLQYGGNLIGNNKLIYKIKFK